MSRPVVLVVDHDQRTYNLLSQVIDTQKFEVASVRSAEKSEVHLHSSSPQAVFLSCHVKGLPTPIATVRKRRLPPRRSSWGKRSQIDSRLLLQPRASPKCRNPFEWVIWRKSERGPCRTLPSSPTRKTDGRREENTTSPGTKRSEVHGAPGS